MSALFLAAVVANAASQPRFLDRTVTAGGITYRYVVSVPMDWSPERAWPIILSLLGSEERGDDGVMQSKVGLGLAVREHPERYPAIVVMPQCRRDLDWNSPATETQALAALDASTQEFHGDPQRTYLTGFSMGGYGTWGIASRHPERFAALVAICGGVVWPPGSRIKDERPYSQVAEKVAGIPVWVFHGNADRNVSVTESREMVKLLRGLHADVRYTEYDRVAHQSWDRAYAETDLPVWLFSQRLKGK